ncbi:hypothetical protein JCGZ_20696 [Jatropha curcas]|uniref:Uncharacterized protein n=1 Tax=Jatropha curcas TaxID=180498 RepID=A0A067JZV9_JATCU|nr:hypothetical protein JCGZ_20696 [Jatropha curcas]
MSLYGTILTWLQTLYGYRVYLLMFHHLPELCAKVSIECADFSCNPLERLKDGKLSERNWQPTRMFVVLAFTWAFAAVLDTGKGSCQFSKARCHGIRE